MRSCRSSEIRSLEARDLDASVIRGVPTLSAREEETLKGEKERIVPIVPQLAEALRTAMRLMSLRSRAPADNMT
jgi:integrase